MLLQRKKKSKQKEKKLTQNEGNKIKHIGKQPKWCCSQYVSDIALVPPPQKKNKRKKKDPKSSNFALRKKNCSGGYRMKSLPAFGPS